MESGPPIGWTYRHDKHDRDEADPGRRRHRQDRTPDRRATGAACDSDASRLTLRARFRPDAVRLGEPGNLGAGTARRTRGIRLLLPGRRRPRRGHRDRHVRGHGSRERRAAARPSVGTWRDRRRTQRAGGSEIRAGVDDPALELVQPELQRGLPARTGALRRGRAAGRRHSRNHSSTSTISRMPPWPHLPRTGTRGSSTR